MLICDYHCYTYFRRQPNSFFILMIILCCKVECCGDTYIFSWWTWGSSWLNIFITFQLNNDYYILCTQNKTLCLWGIYIAPPFSIFIWTSQWLLQLHNASIFIFTSQMHTFTNTAGWPPKLRPFTATGDGPWPSPWPYGQPRHTAHNALTRRLGLDCLALNW